MDEMTRLDDPSLAGRAPAETTDVAALSARVAEEGRFARDLMTAMEQVIVGQRYMLERLLVGLLADGHVLLEGVPGLAKTLAVTSLAQALHAQFQRIQFTPDLLPADLIGTLIYNPQSGEFRVRKGPVFANLVLADEINRAPAKVQSALLEAMQEHQVTIGDETLPAAAAVPGARDPEPDRAGGHLPAARGAGRPLHAEAQGRLPDRDEELAILERMARTQAVPPIAPVADVAQVMRARQLVDRIYVDDKVKRYIVDLVFATRDPKSAGLELASYIDYGASPRASIYLALAAKAHAFLQAAATSRRRTSRRSAWTCCATASSRPTRPRPRTSPPRT